MRIAHIGVANAAALLFTADPRGGQLPIPSGSAVEVSVIFSFRDQPEVALDSLAALLRHAMEVQSIEILLLDVGSSHASAEEVRGFVEHVSAHLGIRLRLFKFDDPRSASVSLAVSSAARTAEGKFMFIMNHDCLVHPGALRALVSLFGSHPDVGMAVPRLLQPSGPSASPGFERLPLPFLTARRYVCVPALMLLLSCSSKCCMFHSESAAFEQPRIGQRLSMIGL